jgi:SAM-dependent methyltransferase
MESKRFLSTYPKPIDTAMTDKGAPLAPQEMMAQAVEGYLDEHGATHAGVGWFREEQVAARYRAMMELIPPKVRDGCTVLDFGCGAAHFLEFLQQAGLTAINYTGLDISPRLLGLARSKYPERRFIKQDVLKSDSDPGHFDFIVMNGIFTQKLSLAEEDMLEYMQRLLARLWPLCKQGLAFNVMSRHVDWERDDLFHASMDAVTRIVVNTLSRHFVIRHDYGLYEYSVYVYRKPLTD